MTENRKRKSKSSHGSKKKQKIKHGNYMLNLSFPYSRAVVMKDKNDQVFKKFELKTKEFECFLPTSEF